MYNIHAPQQAWNYGVPAIQLLGMGKPRKIDKTAEEAFAASFNPREAIGLGKADKFYIPLLTHNISLEIGHGLA